MLAFQRILRWLGILLQNIGFLCVSLLTMMVFVGVVTRYVFGFTLDWVEELSKLMMLIVLFLTIGLFAFRNEHIRFTFFSDRFKGPKANYLRLLHYFVGLLVCVVLALGSYKLVSDEWTTGIRTESTLFELWSFHLFMLVGFGISSLYYLYLCVSGLRNLSLKTEDAGGQESPRPGVL